MERKHMKVWYDAEGDYLEVIFERKEGYFRETANWKRSTRMGT